MKLKIFGLLIIITSAGVVNAQNNFKLVKQRVVSEIEHCTHLSNLVEMSLAFNSKELKQDINRSLKYWCDHDFMMVSGLIKEVKGRRDIYLVFKDNAKRKFDLDWFSFSE